VTVAITPTDVGSLADPSGAREPAAAGFPGGGEGEFATNVIFASAEWGKARAETETRSTEATTTKLRIADSAARPTPRFRRLMLDPETVNVRLRTV
jgi:hypothetical protein